jgi:hypothetical protein
MENIEKLAFWINERHRIYLKKHAGLPKPWTTDPVLQEYRFCNVYRNLDKESIWIQHNWLHPNKDHQLLTLNMCLARLINWSPTLNYIGYQNDWNPERLRKLLKEWRTAGNKVFTGAYIVSTNGKKMDKIDYVIDLVLQPIADELKNPTSKDTLQSYWDQLLNFDGLGSFMAAQVIADIKYVEPLLNAPDWDKWAAMGPGSKRGLNRILGRDINTPIKQLDGLADMQKLHSDIQPLLENHIDFITMQDFQNCLCEVDKYIRVQNKEGTPRSKYAGI